MRTGEDEEKDMNNEKDELKECIAREFEEIAKEEEESLEKDTSLVVPEGTKEAVLARLKEQMREYQREQAENEAREREEAINNLSEEDRKALELGRKMLKAEVGTADTSEKKVHYRRKPLKIYLALAAVIVCVLAMGITSMGGPERVVRMVRQAVGDRLSLPSSTTLAVTVAPATVGSPTLASPLLTKRTWSNVTVSPALTPSFSTLITSPSETVYCLPPVAIIAYIWHLLK